MRGRGLVYPERRARGSAASRAGLIRALEPDAHPARGPDGDQAAEKPLAASLGDNLVLQAVGAAGHNDIVDPVSPVELELPAEPLRVGRLPLPSMNGLRPWGFIGAAKRRSPISAPAP